MVLAGTRSPSVESLVAQAPARRPFVFAHRGPSMAEPEHTLAAWRSGPTSTPEHESCAASCAIAVP